MDKKPELLVIDPSIIRPEIEAFNLISRLSKIPVSFHLPALEGMDSIWEAEKSAFSVGAIILGSAASVREQRDWQRELTRWIGNRIGPQFPILGICFGHQLLAYMHGASVIEAKKKHLGFRKVKVLEDRRLSLTAQEVPLFVAHGDKVDEVPDSFELFASSEAIHIDGLRHKSHPIWSFQPHVDATETFAMNSHYSHKEEFHQFSFGNQILNSFLLHILTYLKTPFVRSN
jgi:GMP synthase-like glutamine amidotransferase